MPENDAPRPPGMSWAAGRGWGEREERGRGGEREERGKGGERGKGKGGGEGDRKGGGEGGGH